MKRFSLQHGNGRPCRPGHSASLAPAQAAEQLNPPRANWSFAGIFGTFDRAQLQRGFQVYKEVCAACHGLSLVSFRNLSQPGGPEFTAAQAAAIAADWTHKVREIGDDGQPAERAPRLADRIPGPFANVKAAEAANGGKAPPDLVADAEGPLLRARLPLVPDRHRDSATRSTVPTT